MGNHAEDWYTSLTEEVKNDFGSLKAKFLERFDSNVDRVHSYSVFLELSQGSDSVDSFIEKVLKCGRTLNKSEAEMMDKIIHGLHKEIKNFVIMKEANSLEDVTKYARMGQSITSSENSQVCSVTSQKNNDFHGQGNHSDRSPYYPHRDNSQQMEDNAKITSGTDDRGDHSRRCVNIVVSAITYLLHANLRMRSALSAISMAILQECIVHILRNRDSRLSLRVLGMGTKGKIM